MNWNQLRAVVLNWSGFVPGGHLKMSTDILVGITGERLMGAVGEG